MPRLSARGPALPARPSAQIPPGPEPDAPLPLGGGALAASEQESLLLRQRLLDASARATNGCFTYTLLWIVACQAGEFYGRQTTFVWLHAAGLTLVGLLRVALHRMLPRLLAHSLRTGGLLLHSVTMAHAVYWGVLWSATYVWPEAEALKYYMLTIGVGLAIGGTLIMGIDAVLGLGYPVALLSPMIATLLYQGTTESTILALLAVVCMAYIVVATRTIRADYDKAQRSQLLLQERARQLEILSLTDGLTQVPNRLYFDRRLPGEWLRATRQAYPLTVALIDLDHFKSINDRYGHPVGDRCLRAAADALRMELQRAGDVVSRYGGEEFVALLPHTDEAGARAVADRLLACIRELQLEQDGEPLPLTCSIGICSVRPQGAADGATQLLQRADDALYQAKTSGRNRAVALPFQPQDSVNPSAGSPASAEPAPTELN